MEQNIVDAEVGGCGMLMDNMSQMSDKRVC